MVDESLAGLESVAVVDGDGARQLVKLKDPLMLPPAPKSAAGTQTG